MMFLIFTSVFWVWNPVNYVGWDNFLTTFWLVQRGPHPSMHVQPLHRNRKLKMALPLWIYFGHWEWSDLSAAGGFLLDSRLEPHWRSENSRFPQDFPRVSTGFLPTNLPEVGLDTIRMVSPLLKKHSSNWDIHCFFNQWWMFKKLVFLELFKIFKIFTSALSRLLVLDSSTSEICTCNYSFSVGV